MKRIILLLIPLAGAGILFFGCKETVSSSGSPGDIIGTIIQVDDTLYQPTPDKSGVKVSLVGMPYSALSDSSGKWHLTNIPAGTYMIRFSKDGYVSHTVQNFIFGGNGTYFYNLDHGEVYLYPIPNLFPDIVLRPFEDWIQISEHDTTWRDSAGRYHDNYVYDTVITKLDLATFSSRSQFMDHGQNVFGAIFFGKNENIDPSDPTSYIYSTLNVGYYYVNDSSGLANIAVHRSSLLQSGFSEGETIYCCAYASISYDHWLDANTGCYAYSGFSPHHSEVKSFILP